MKQYLKNIFSDDNIIAETFKYIEVRPPWGSDLPLSVLTYLLTEGSNGLGSELCTKGNDMELFHFLTGGPHTIDQAFNILHKNMPLIKHLIVDMKFTPFPPRPKAKQIDGFTNITQINPSERYPPKDGYENNRQLNVIARAILISKDLVNLWKKIGYCEICDDVNDLVMQGQLLILFPPNPSAKWVQPNTLIVSERLKELVDLGFDLSYSVIVDIFLLFEKRLKNIGEILTESFINIKEEHQTTFLEKTSIELLKNSRNLKDLDILDFLFKCLHNPETVFNNILDYFIDNTNESSNNISLSVKSLTFSPKFYYWILIKFGTDSNLTIKCFEEILDTFVNLDIQLQQNSDNEIYQILFKSTCDILFAYCNVKNFFKPLHLDKLFKCTNNDILCIVFEHYLPLLFGIEITQMLLPLPTTEEFYLHYTPNSNTKRECTKQELEDWFSKLENIFYTLYYEKNNATEEFKKSLFIFCETKLPESNFVSEIRKKRKINYE
ncbi:172_t:CDS:2 [Cetraspora pellucida]|uniref:172_t:CDS:1 n=1 Tax=Cetraspora pellucida TaxID=1433469 RepID=A0A9N9AJ45_9GLOM|nr:172_t:CDS:2 [Cetraspora pellucida]